VPAAKVLRTLVLLTLFVVRIPGWAQDRCGTDEYLKTFQPALTPALFEDWMEKRKAVRSLETGRTKAEPYKIPVVVHVIHFGENHETNIPDAQIFSQIKVLNEDFRRLNADASSTPAVFASVAGSIDIEFVLAKQDPEGLPTDGIVRVQGSKSEWTINDQTTLKNLSNWPSDKYLNIWVCNESDYLGYAQFPETDLLPGLENASHSAATDGVVITYDAFGSINDGNFNLRSAYNRGRTCTHEVGHYFGLRHIWGDDKGGCGGNGDYVTDTPDQGDRTLNCPAHPRTTCSTTSMFQNYLDYTNDGCMNLFTAGQISRMKIILDNSPRRKTLSSSAGLNEPVSVPNDLGIKAIVSPKSGSCAGSLTPVITVRNYGDNEITAFTVSMSVDDNFVEERSFNSALLSLQSMDVSFSNVQLTNATAKFTFEITETNMGPDGKVENNERTTITTIPKATTLPLFESITGELPDKWVVENPDGGDNITWTYSIAPSETPDNGALKMDFYNYEDSEGELDLFVSPVMDFRNAPQALLSFDVSYAPYLDSEDGLKVLILKNCNTDFTTAETVYLKTGTELQTATKTDDAFTPSSRSDWRTDAVDLSAYIGEPSIQIAFVGINDWGNNLYADNIRVITDDFRNVNLLDIVSPPPVTCSSSMTPVLRVRNSGSSTASLEIQYIINGITKTEMVDVENFVAGTEVDIPMTDAVTLNAGENTISFSIVKVDGLEDADPTDNMLTRTVIYSSASSAIPFRETFESETDDWISLSPAGNASWVESEINGNGSMVYKGFTNTVVGDEAWLVSPVLDLSAATEASLRFFTSYRRGINGSELLELRASVGCDAPFDEVLASWSGSNLETLTSEQDWTPASKDDYSEKDINVNAVAGAKDVRFAFVVTNNNANNLHIDDIEFFLSDFPGDVEIDDAFIVYPNPATPDSEITLLLNLTEPTNGQIEIVDAMGKRTGHLDVNNLLNQALPLDFSDKGPGVYIIRVITPDKTYSSKFVYIR
jgi:hypothetical protein